MTKNWNDENEKTKKEILKNEMMKKLIDDKMKWWRKWNNEMTKNEMMKIILEQKQLILNLQKKTNWINIHKKRGEVNHIS